MPFNLNSTYQKIGDVLFFSYIKATIDDGVNAEQCWAMLMPTKAKGERLTKMGNSRLGANWYGNSGYRVLIHCIQN